MDRRCTDSVFSVQTSNFILFIFSSSPAMISPLSIPELACFLLGLVVLLLLRSYLFGSPLQLVQLRSLQGAFLVQLEREEQRALAELEDEQRRSLSLLGEYPHDATRREELARGFQQRTQELQRHFEGQRRALHEALRRQATHEVGQSR